jgi:hypothetical protein
MDVVVSSSYVESASRPDSTTLVDETITLDDGTVQRFEYVRNGGASASTRLAARVADINAYKPMERIREVQARFFRALDYAATAEGQEAIAAFYAAQQRVTTMSAVPLREGQSLVVDGYTWTCVSQATGTVEDVPDIGEFAPWPGHTGGIMITGPNGGPLLSYGPGDNVITLEFTCAFASALIKDVHLEMAGSVPGPGAVLMYGSTTDAGFDYSDSFQLVLSNDSARDGATLLSDSTPVETVEDNVDLAFAVSCQYGAAVATFAALQPLT